MNLNSTRQLDEIGSTPPPECRVCQQQPAVGVFEAMLSTDDPSVKLIFVVCVCDECAAQFIADKDFLFDTVDRLMHEDD